MTDAGNPRQPASVGTGNLVQGSSRSHMVPRFCPLCWTEQRKDAAHFAMKPYLPAVVANPHPVAVLSWQFRNPLRNCFARQLVQDLLIQVHSRKMIPLSEPYKSLINKEIMLPSARSVNLCCDETEGGHWVRRSPLLASAWRPSSTGLSSISKVHC